MRKENYYLLCHSVLYKVDPDIAIDSKDNVYVVWEERFRSGMEGDVGRFSIVLREKTSSGWLPIEILGGEIGGVFANPMSTTTIHIIWEDVDCVV